MPIPRTTAELLQIVPAYCWPLYRITDPHDSTPGWYAEESYFHRRGGLGLSAFTIEGCVHNGLVRLAGNVAQLVHVPQTVRPRVGENLLTLAQR